MGQLSAKILSQRVHACCESKLVTYFTKSRYGFRPMQGILARVILPVIQQGCLMHDPMYVALLAERWHGHRKSAVTEQRKEKELNQ